VTFRRLAAFNFFMGLRIRQTRMEIPSHASPAMARMYLRLGAVQSDQTTVWATRRMMCREEMGQSLQGHVRFVQSVRLHHGNSLDCFASAFSDRRRGLGIFAVEALTQLLNKLAHVRIDPIRGMHGGRSAPISMCYSTAQRSKRGAS
jgi:hypothetical protein